MTSAIKALWLREIRTFVRDRARVAGAVVQPLAIWALLGVGFSAAFRLPGADQSPGYVAFLFPGIIALVVLFTAIFSTISVVEDRQREQNGVGAAQFGYFFAQASDRQQMSVAPRTFGVEQNQIEGARQTPKLKAVVQNYNLGAVLQRQFDSAVPIFGDRHNCARQVTRVQSRFVAHALRPQKGLLAIGNEGAVAAELAAVAAQSHADAHATFLQRARNPLRRRRFAGSAGCQVAHRNNRAGRNFAFAQSQIRRAPPPHGATIKRFGGQK